MDLLEVLGLAPDGFLRWQPLHRACPIESVTVLCPRQHPSRICGLGNRTTVAQDNHIGDGNYSFADEIIEGTLPVRGYVAGVRLHRVTHCDRTFAEWWADFEVVGADRDATVAQIGNNVFAAGFRAVAAKGRLRRGYFQPPTSAVI